VRIEQGRRDDDLPRLLPRQLAHAGTLGHAADVNRWSGERADG
jgi:hypothetical protein